MPELPDGPVGGGWLDICDAPPLPGMAETTDEAS
jgi:hypothetical protein